MIKDFTEAMSGRTDKQLADILTINKEDYVPEAIIAAEKELEKRKLNIDTFYTPEQVKELKEAKTENKAEKQFEWYHKVLTFFSPIIGGVIVYWALGRVEGLGMLKSSSSLLLIGGLYFLHMKIKDAGYTRMAEDFKKWITYTVYIYILFFVILIILYFVFGFSRLLIN
jgi:hypothetical protein